VELNTSRKEIEKIIFSEIQVAIDAGKIDLSRENILLAASKQWAPGVIGLVASRLVSTYGRPAILLHITPEVRHKGSCRSIPEFNMFDALTEQQSLLEHFGGHSMAAGLSIKLEHIPAFKAALEERIVRMLTPYDLQQKLLLDAQVTLPEVNKQLVQ
jgi:single-stranded-DNA-specific exonuclease